MTLLPNCYVPRSMLASDGLLLGPTNLMELRLLISMLPCFERSRILFGNWKPPGRSTRGKAFAKTRTLLEVSLIFSSTWLRRLLASAIPTLSFRLEYFLRAFSR